MLLQTKFSALLGLTRRQLSTAQRLNFKFKLTEGMSKEFEEKEKAKEQPVENLSLHTKENPLIMGRVSSERHKKVIRVGVPKHRMNEVLLMYIRENDPVYALDDNDICNPGDWVLLRRDDTIVDPKIRHKVEKVVHSYGNYVDPLTGRRSLGLYYEDDMERLEKIKMEL